MAKTISDVLNERELEKIAQMESDMRDIRLAKLLDNVLRIDCSLYADKVVVATYKSLNSPFMHVYRKSVAVKAAPKKPDEELLLKKRAGHRKSITRRHMMLLDELRIRANDILVHKWYLSESESYDVGIVKASAHWLKEAAPVFYEQSESHHKELGINFVWNGMEKSVCIAASNKQGNESYYVLVMSGDLLFEENLAQVGSGLFMNKELEEKAKAVRGKLTQLHETQYFCILKK